MSKNNVRSRQESKNKKQKLERMEFVIFKNVLCILVTSLFKNKIESDIYSKPKILDQ